MKYYRGYVATKGKKSIDKFKGVPDEELRTLEDAKKLDSWGSVGSRYSPLGFRQA